MSKAVLASVLTYLVMFFAPIAEVLVLCGILVLCDLYTGVKAAKSRKEAITSDGFKRTVAKVTLYFIAILLSRGMEVVYFPNIPIASITSG